MENRTPVAAGAIAVAAGGVLITGVLAVVMIAAAAVGGTASLNTNTGAGNGGSDGGAALNTSAVPAAYVPWITQAGGICSAITPPVVAGQIDIESTFADHPPNSAGAAGPGQFTEPTWREWGVDADHNGTKDLHSVPDSVVATGRMDCGMVKILSAKFPKNPDPVGLALAAYHDGAGAVEAAGGVPKNKLTQWYVSTIESLAKNKYSAVTVTAGTLAAKAIAAAKAELGVPYSYAGGTPQGPTVGRTSPAGWDCSSYLQMAYYRASAGKIMLPRTTYDQMASNLVTTVPMSQIQPGDLIFVNTGADGFGHVVMYLGGGKIIEEPHTGEVSRIAPLSEYHGMTTVARRVKGA